MIRLALLVATTTCLVPIPAFANPVPTTDGLVKVAQLNLCIGPRCGDGIHALRGHRFDRDYGFVRDYRVPRRRR
jgi:hypothetical protein